jgi:S1-C subfamily serine protease
MPTLFVKPDLDVLLAGEQPVVRAPGFELGALDLVSARERGLSDARIQAILEHDPERRQVLEIRRVHGDAPATGEVRETDLLLEVDGKTLTRMAEFEVATRKPSIAVTVLRDGEELQLSFDTLALDGAGIQRVVSWAGLLLHEPHEEVEAQQGFVAEGVYIAWLWYGSPGSRYGLRPTRRIVAIDDVPTPNLDALLAAVAGRGDRDAVRVTLEKLDGSEMVQTLKLDLQYWPTQVFRRGAEGHWIRSAPSEEAR